MKLSSLEISCLRNLKSVKLPALGQVNVLYGLNGAGKTSVLEAIHMLGLARSFRSTQLNPVIQHEKSSCTVFGRLESEDGSLSTTLGIKRQRRGGVKIRIAGADEKSVIRLAELLPIQLINATSYLLLEGGPKQRRQFIDWGVFHVEHSFYDAWRKVQRSLKQRNALLRSGGSSTQLEPWTQELIGATKILDSARRRYVERFIPVFNRLLRELINLEGIELKYFAGWDTVATDSFETALNESFDRDLRRGLTHLGPHRADLKIIVQGIDAGLVLSRGQQKLVVCALRLAQSTLLGEESGKQSVLLIDDLPAEIDSIHQARLCKLLDQLGMQLFLTCIDAAQAKQFSWPELGSPQLFHVKQGVVEAVL